jgi:DNA/RNA endonuclease G (NUC1)
MSNDVDFSDYLVSIREVENETGLDVLHELPNGFENLIERSVWDIWPDL